MAKKAARKTAKKATTKSKKLAPAEKLAQTLNEIGQRGHQLSPTDFGRGQHGYSVFLCGEGEHTLVTLNLIQKDDGTWRVKTELATWLRDEIEKAGFKIAERKKPERQERTLRPTSEAEEETEEEGIIQLRP